MQLFKDDSNRVCVYILAPFLRNPGQHAFNITINHVRVYNNLPADNVLQILPAIVEAASWPECQQSMNATSDHMSVITVGHSASY